MRPPVKRWSFFFAFFSEKYFPAIFEAFLLPEITFYTKVLQSKKKCIKKCVKYGFYKDFLRCL